MSSWRCARPARRSCRRRRSCPAWPSCRRTDRCSSCAILAVARRLSRATSSVRAARTWSTSRAGWTRGRTRGYRCDEGHSSPAKATFPRAERVGRARLPTSGLPAPYPVEDAPEQLPRLRLVSERHADEDQDDEVDRAHGGRVQVAQLLADLAFDLEARDSRTDEPELEERAEWRGVRSGAGGKDRVRGRLPADEDRLGTADDGGRPFQARLRK